jgi:repressor LexA
MREYLLTGNDRFPYIISMTIDEAARKVKRFYIENRRMPSYQELGRELGILSKKNSFRWAKKLIEAGLLGKDRKGKLFPKSLFSVPDFGVIRAGYAAPAHRIEGDSIDLYQFLLNLPPEIFSLTVKGDSMIDASIREGDIALIDPNRQALDGDIVAALVDGECTLKYFYKDHRGVRLVPANPEYPTIYPQNELVIQGVVVHLIRKFR